MRIESSVARRALMRQTIVVLVLLIFAGWFAWDGFVGYPTKNAKQAMSNFPVTPKETVAQHADVTAESAGELQSKVKAAGGTPVTLPNLIAAWKEPAYLGPAEASDPSGPQAAYFVGSYGWAKVALTGEVATSIDWFPAEKNDSAVAVQKLLAAVLAVVAMIPLATLLSLMAGKYVLDDEGLTLPGNKRVAYGAMTDLDLTSVQRGMVRLKYQDARGEEASVLLDEERIDKFDDIVLTLCEQKGWQDKLDEAASKANPPADGDNPQS